MTSPLPTGNPDGLKKSAAFAGRKLGPFLSAARETYLDLGARKRGSAKNGNKSNFALVSQTDVWHHFVRVPNLTRMKNVFRVRSSFCFDRLNGANAEIDKIAP